jgi:Ala-tRNA(Pro) deacylase
MNVINYLRSKGVAFEVLPHKDTQDASHLAQALHSAGKCVSKCILTSADHGFRSFVAILPATHQIDLEKLSQCLGGAKIELVREEELVNYCPDCEVGVVPPFGSEYGMGTIVDQCVTENPMMLFEGNSHHEAVRMKYQDFKRIENPLVGDFASPRA